MDQGQLKPIVYSSLMAICAFAMIKNTKNEILLVELAPPFAESHKWNFPGGVIEKYEAIHEGLVREVVEETNILCTVLERMDSFITPSGTDQINIYEAIYKSGEIIVQKEEVLQAKWYTSQEALALPLAFNIKDYIAQLSF